MKALPLACALMAVAVCGSVRAADDVTASGLIAEIKHSQDWLGHIKTFNVTFKVDELRPPGSPPEKNQLQSEQLAFDEHRFYRSLKGTTINNFAWWDGKVSWSSSNRGYLQIRDSMGYFEASIVWGRNGQRFWSSGQNPPSDVLGAASSYVRDKDQTFEGKECYVLADAEHHRKVYVGIADHRWYGMVTDGSTYSFGDYKEVAPGDWYPMTQGQKYQGTDLLGKPLAEYVFRVADIAIDKPLPDSLFEKKMASGTHVDEDIGGQRRKYVYLGDRSAAEQAEIQADEARQRAFGPPEILPGQGVVLGSRADPLPVSPLAAHLAPEFPAEAKWIGKPLKLADQRGKVVIVLFWASWADFYADGLMALAIDPPALTLPPEIANEAMLVGVHVPTAEVGRVEKAVKDNKWSFPICIDVEGKNKWGQMADGYRVDELPVFYVIDQEGKVAALGSWPEAVRRAGELLGKSGVKPKD